MGLGKAGAADWDGTQSDQPFDSFADPLSGLVTGATAAPMGESEPIEVVPPVQPDQDTVRKMVDATLSGDQLAEAQRRSMHARAVARQNQPPLGMLPRESHSPPQKVLRPKKKRKPRQPKAQPASSAGTKLTPGFVATVTALVLLVAFIIIAITALSSLFNSVGSLF